MAANLLSLRVLSAILLSVSADPAPGRIPKVYNALITSNQNLEPSKSFPIYQPVLQDPFGFPLHPFYQGDYPFNNGIVPQETSTKSSDESEQPAPTPLAPEAPANPPSSEPAPVESSSPAPVDSSTLAPPPQPNTESPIPLNEFGLPSQVLPLGRVHPAYNGFTHLGPFSYAYPGLRLYDTYEPYYNLGPYGFPFYRPLPNVLGPPSIGIPSYRGAGAPLVPVQAPSEADPSAQTPPPEPSDLNVLNYSSKDPAIPNVPPPPLPQGGLKSEKSE